jgi:para-nitrobenzyl esterase
MSGRGPKTELLPELVGSGEDCLTLNIWSKDLGSSGQPVMVRVPGGLYEYHGTGACPWYDGSRFARDGVVCVTINYRVGADGFLYLGDGIANLGLLDQVAALEWVRDNIADFGGDPGNVTIFGESAGALSIGTLLSMPRAAGLFRRAIVQSGGAHHVSSAATDERIGKRVAERMSVPATRDAIAAAPLERMIEAQIELRNDLLAQPDPAFWGEVALTNHGPNPPQSLADAMHGAWLAFAATGDPGWPKYDLSRRATMHFDTSSQVMNDPLARERAWEGVR